MTTPVTWTKRWTFILAAAGSAVGLGNIWKFPYIAGENGGGAFIAVYLLCILAIGIPTMMAEALLGKAGRANPIVAVRKLALHDGKSPNWAWLGAMGIVTGVMIIMFYSVVAGWALNYVAQSVSGAYANANAEITSANFAALASSSSSQIMGHTIFLALNGLVIGFGIKKGIGIASEILMPLLMLILVGLVGYSAIEGDMTAALRFMFDFNFSALSGDAIIVAMGHAFFTLSIGMGSIMVYGSYMPQDACIGRSVLTIAVMDTAIALLAGLAIYPLVFGGGLEAGSGPGLMFETLPLAFGNMPAGLVIGTAFFTLVSIAALTSSISLLEPAVAWMEQLGIKRWISTTIMVAIAWVGGLASIYNASVFNFLDYATANIMLPVGGLIIAILCGWVLRRVSVRKQLNTISMGWFNAWYIAVRFLAPIGIVTVLINGLMR